MYYNDYNKPQEPVIEGQFRVEPESPFEPPKKSKKSRSGVKLTAICLSCALVGGLVGGGAVHLFGGGNGSTVIYEGTHDPVAVSMSSVKTDEPLTLPQIYAMNVNATVGITTELVTTNFWGQTVKGAAAGSGFVITEDGYILTNYHVIDGASSIKVAFVDGTTYPATLVGGEPANDIAVLKIDGSDLPTVVLGDSDNLVVGEEVCAIGNPLGELTYSFTCGHVSAKDRTITMQNGESMNMLQTDTAINSGNSGGPLFNSYGQVIGITSAKYSSNGSSGTASIEGIGFAIPINDVKDMVMDFIEHGYVTGRPNVGIFMDDVTQQDSTRYGIPTGAYVSAVLPGSCAEKAGLKESDIITAVNDTVVTSSAQLKSAIKDFKAGDEVTFTVFREGKNVSLPIVLDEATQERAEAMQEFKEELVKKAQEEQQAQQEQQQQQQVIPFNPFSPFGW